MMGRRGALWAGLSFAALAMIWRRTRPPRATLVAHPRLPGFLVLESAGSTQVSQASGPGAALIGLGDPDARTPDPALVDAVAADPVAALFGAAPAPAIAYFTDIRCPLCRVLEADLDRLQAERPGLTRVTHDYPVFGASSERAARALVAAGPELAPTLRSRLMRSNALVDDTQLRRVLLGMGTDPDPILARMNSAETLQTLDTTRALAQLLGLYGTPALVLGRAVLLGAHPLSTLKAVLDLQSA